MCFLPALWMMMAHKASPFKELGDEYREVFQGPFARPPLEQYLLRFLLPPLCPRS